MAVHGTVPTGYKSSAICGASELGLTRGSFASRLRRSGLALLLHRQEVFTTFELSVSEDFHSVKEKDVHDTCEYMLKAPIPVPQQFTINSGHTNLLIGPIHWVQDCVHMQLPLEASENR
jgi:hypothetical protein